MAGRGRLSRWPEGSRTFARVLRESPLKIKALVWLEDVVDKLLWKHDVEEHEVREALESLPLFRFVEKGHRKGEDV